MPAQRTGDGGDKIGHNYFMTRADFTAALEHDLQFRAVAFSRAELQAFVAAAWPWIDDDPDVAFWATEFLLSGRELAGV